jgi:hypothetical protein
VPPVSIDKFLELSITGASHLDLREKLVEVAKVVGKHAAPGCGPGGRFTMNVYAS